MQNRKRETRELNLLGCRATLQVNCSHLLGRALPGLQFQVARQVPQLHHQVAEEHSHILHLSEEKAHPVVQERGGAWASRGRAGRWRQRPGRLRSRHSWSHGFRSGVQGRWCTRAQGTWVWDGEHTYSDIGSLALACLPFPSNLSCTLDCGCGAQGSRDSRTPCPSWLTSETLQQ